MPLFPEVEDESLTGFQGGDKFWWAACAAAPHPALRATLSRKGRGSMIKLYVLLLPLREKEGTGHTPSVLRLRSGTHKA